MIDNNSGDYAVLFVDDEEKALKYFTKAVAGRFPVLTAGNVQEAEEILKTKSNQIAVVISDQRMPGENGVELLKRVRSRHPSIVRLLTTAYSDLNDAIEAINRGEIYRYIQKPWRVESLQAEVKGAFDYFHLQRERDLLLAEKLSARQRMTGIERLSQLLVFARTYRGLQHADYAIRDFFEYLHMLPGAWESDGLARVDQWELTMWESKRLTDFVRQVTGTLLAVVPEPASFPDRISTCEIAQINDALATQASCRLSIEQAADGGEQPWASNRKLLEFTLGSVYALFAQIPGGLDQLQLSIFPTTTRNGTGPAIGLRFQAPDLSWPTDRHLLSGSALTAVHPIYEQALACSLASAQHGGRCTISYDNGELTVSMSLPVSTEPSTYSLPILDWDWLPEVLAYYEPSIEEFYSDL